MLHESKVRRAQHARGDCTINVPRSGLVSSSRIGAPCRGTMVERLSHAATGRGRRSLSFSNARFSDRGRDEKGHAPGKSAGRSVGLWMLSGGVISTRRPASYGNGLRSRLATTPQSVKRCRRLRTTQWEGVPVSENSRSFTSYSGSSKGIAKLLLVFTCTTWKRTP